MKFTLKIHTDNEAMQTRADVARTLRELSPRLNDGPKMEADGGPVFDDNGNTVGRWSFEPTMYDDTPDPLQGRDPDELHERNR